MTLEKPEAEPKKRVREKYAPPIEEVVEEEDEVQTYHNPNKLIRLGTWSSTISWIVLAVTVVVGIVQLYLNVQQVNQYGQVPPLAWVYYIGDGLQTILIGVFYFIVLQAVAEGINILLDIFENTTSE
jgi:anti-sigma-K factor RskA